MKSKTSYFSPAIFRDNFRRFWPIWLAYLALWGVVLLSRVYNATLWTSGVSDMEYSIRLAILHTLDMGVFVSGAAGCISAMAVFSYLHSIRAAGMYHALPVRREGLFLTHYLSGLVWPLVANCLLLGLLAVWELTMAADFMAYLAQWFAAISLQYVFFYSLAVLCAMLVGHLLAMPVAFITVNYCAAAVTGAVQQLLRMCLFGYQPGEGAVTGWLTPVRKLREAVDVLYPNGRSVNGWSTVIGSSFYAYEDYAPADHVNQFHLAGWSPMVIYALAGLALAFLALALYRRRRIEAAGDVVGIPALRRLFPYILSLAGALLLGGTFYRVMLWDDLTTPGPGPVICMVLGGLLGFYAARVLLGKSFAVFHGTLRPAAVMTGVVLLMALVIRVDVFGYERSVPGEDEVVSVTLEVGGNATTLTGRETIAETLEAHRVLISEKQNYRALLRETRQDGAYTWLSLTYTLDDGRQMVRQYTVPVTGELMSDTGGTLYRMESLLNCQESIDNRKILFDEREVSYGGIFYCDENGETQYYTLTAAQTEEIYRTCLVPDMTEGTTGRTVLYMDEAYNAYAQYCYVEINLTERTEGEDGTYYLYTHMNFQTTTGSDRTNAYLAGLGIEPLVMGEVYALWDW